MVIVLIWIIGGIATAVVASAKGYSGFKWFWYGLLILPVAILHAFAIPRRN